MLKLKVRKNQREPTKYQLELEELQEEQLQKTINEAYIITEVELRKVTLNLSRSLIELF